MKRLLILAAFLCLVAIPARATNAVYLAATSAGGDTGADCANAKAYTYFNSSGNWNGSPTGIQIGPDTTVHLCGTTTATVNTTLLTFQGSGTSGHPITLLWESGAILQAPYFAFAGGAVNTNGKSWLVIDGGSNGIIQNTANGTSLANHASSKLIHAESFSNSIIRNLTLANTYVRAAGDALNGVDQTLVVAIKLSGSHFTVTGNTIHDCGFCVEDFYANGDTDHTVTLNDFYNFDHAVAYATAAANSASGFYFLSNKVHDSANWDTSGCSYHHDGLHTYGVAGSSMTEVYVGNNYFYGDWGACFTGFIFIEGGTTNPSHMVNGYYWNNYGEVPIGAAQANGWIEIFSGSGVTKFFQNTVKGPSGANGSTAFNIGSVSNLTSYGNVAVGFGGVVNYGSLSGTATIDYNFYDTFCNLGNCYIFNGAFKGNFANWKAALSAAGVVGAEAHSVQSATPLLNADGSPQTSSPVLGASLNLSSLATGGLASLQNDTTKGGTRTALARPGGSTLWAIGAYQLAGNALALTPNPVAFGSVNTGTTTSPSTVTVTNGGATNVTLGSPTFYSITGAQLSEFAKPGGTCAPGMNLAPSATCTATVTASPAAAGLRQARLNMIGSASGSTDLTVTGVVPGGGGGGATNKVNLVTEVKGILPPVNGGTGIAAPGALNNVLTSDGSGHWTSAANPGAGGGTVTTFSAGNLSPLFTTSVSNASTTPALSFSLSNFAAHKYYGNGTGSTGAPSATSIGEADLPAATVFTDVDATFGAHTYDFSGVTLMKARVGAGLTTSANGDFGYDTTNKNWHDWTNGADKLRGVWSSTPTNGNCVQASVASSVVLLADSGNPCPSGSNLNKRAIPFSIGDPAGSALTVASTTTDYFSDVPVACTITGYSLAIDAGTITVKFWRKATGTAIPTSSDSISTSGVSISSGTTIRSSTTSDFTSTAISAHDILAMNVTAVATAKYVTGVLECDQ